MQMYMGGGKFLKGFYELNKSCLSGSRMIRNNLVRIRRGSFST